MRNDRAMKLFRDSFRRTDYDLKLWRSRHESEFLGRGEKSVLDLEDGLGWDLAAQMLRPRPLYDQTSGSTLTQWASSGNAIRISCQDGKDFLKFLRREIVGEKFIKTHK